MRGNQPINDGRDIITQDDVSQRIDYLEEDDEPLSQEDKDELTELRQLQEDMGDDSIIREDYFQQYAQDMAEDMHGNSIFEWPSSCIDWEQATTELLIDYTAIDYNGETYYYRQ